MSDSCAVFFVNLPAEYRLHHGLDCLHARDETVLFYTSRSAVAGRHADEPYDRIAEKAGPGMPLKTYVPKGDAVENWDAKIRKFLTPSTESAAVAQRYADLTAQQSRNFTRVSVAPDFLRMKEKRLDLNKWLVCGTNVGGSHFPLCVFTNNRGRRSETKTHERYTKRNVRRSRDAEQAEQAPRWPPASSSSASSAWSSAVWVTDDGKQGYVWTSLCKQDDDER